MTVSRTPFVWRKPVESDIASLVRSYGDEIKTQIADVIGNVQANPRLGDWLGVHPETGDLSDCRKVPFGPHEYDESGVNLGPALRFVYRLRPSNIQFDRIETVAIAPRRALIAYHLAAQRLGRQQP